MTLKTKKKKQRKKELQRRRRNQLRSDKCFFCKSRIEQKPKHITFSKGRPKKIRGGIKTVERKENEIHKRARFEAFLGNYMNFGSYLNSYHSAFDALVETVEESNGHVDYLAFPILFTARHAMELGFKANIKYFAKYSEKNDFTNSDSHSLKDLFEGFKLHVSETIDNLKTKYGVEIPKDEIEEYKKYRKIVDELVDRFDILDKGSTCFRYPVDKDNERVFQPRETVNILNIKELFEKTMTLIYHTSDLFSQYTDYVDDCENEMRESSIH